MNLRIPEHSCNLLASEVTASQEGLLPQVNYLYIHTYLFSNILYGFPHSCCTNLFI